LGRGQHSSGCTRNKEVYARLAAQINDRNKGSLARTKRSDCWRDEDQPPDVDS
jgi:hypothetical protein